MRIIAVASQKGGVGKTTLAINLSAALAKKGKRVLTVDMDPQGHCAVGVALPEDRIERTIFDCLKNGNTPETLDLAQVTWQVAPNHDLAPASSDLVTLDHAPVTTNGQTTLLKRTIDSATRMYDVCIIDCPPYPGSLMRNALYAADEIIIPVETSYYALHDLPGQIDTFQKIARSEGRRVRIHAVPTLYDVRTKLAREILAELRQRFGDVITTSVINFNTKLKEGACYGQPITEFAPGSSGAHDFEALADELLTKTCASVCDEATVSTVAARLAKDSDRLLATPVPLISARTADPSVQARKAAATETRHQQIEAKIAAAYGAQEVSDGVVFRTHRPGAQLVQLAGDFNDWTPQATLLEPTGEEGVFEAKLRLSKGRYRYRLVVDGRWDRDPDNPLAEPNENGEINSVVEVR